MSSEMRKELEQLADECEGLEGLGSAVIGERIRALLARTEAGADECTLGVGDGSGQLFVHGSYDAIKACQALILRNAAPVADGVVDITSRDYQAGFDAGVDFYDDGSGRNRDWRNTNPQDASGDAEDAARWRHVRKDGLIWRVNMLALAKDDIDILFGAKADAAIDAAMQAKEAK